MNKQIIVLILFMLMFVASIIANTIFLKHNIDKLQEIKEQQRIIDSIDRKHYDLLYPANIKIK